MIQAAESQYHGSAVFVSLLINLRAACLDMTDNSCRIPAHCRHFVADERNKAPAFRRGPATQAKITGFRRRIRDFVAKYAI